MAKFPTGWTVGSVAQQLRGTVVGNGQLPVLQPTSLDQPVKGGLIFAENAAYLEKAVAAGCEIALVPHDLSHPDITVIQLENPRRAFFSLLEACRKEHPVPVGIHPTAVISPLATVDSMARIGAYVVVESGAVIGPNAVLYPHVYVGENSHVGAHCVLYPHVVLMADVVLGDHSVLHPHVTIGADGFGYVFQGGRHQKVPQVGGVRVGEHVEVGANSTIDRGTTGDTIILDGVKLDNLVMIGHNVKLGRHVICASQSGISGSATLGDGVVMAGQAGVADHVTLASGVVLAGRAGATSNIEEPGTYLGFPARPAPLERRNMAVASKLAELYRRVKALEKQLESET